MALVAAEPPSCSLIPTCSRAPVVTYYLSVCVFALSLSCQEGSKSSDHLSVLGYTNNLPWMCVDGLKYLST